MSADDAVNVVLSGSVPAVSGAEMAAVDRVMGAELGLDLLQVMEVAGLAVAGFARGRFLSGDPRGRVVLVLAGGGGNGGDGLVAARYLHGWGATVRVLLDRAPERLGRAAAHQARILGQIGVAVGFPGAARWPVEPPEPADLLLDALLGFGLARPPEGPTARLIHLANAAPGPILAVDLPSGLDATSGIPFDPTVRATATLTLGLPKTGLLAATAASVAGEIAVADIGIPAEAYRRAGLDDEQIARAATLFARAAIIPIGPDAGNREAAGRAGGDDA